MRGLRRRQSPGRAVGVLVYLPLGLDCLAVLLITPFFMEGVWWYPIRVCLPLACVALFIFANGYAAFASLIRLAQRRIAVTAATTRKTEAAIRDHGFFRPIRRR